jgi:hypothetical protein
MFVISDVRVFSRLPQNLHIGDGRRIILRHQRLQPRHLCSQSLLSAAVVLDALGCLTAAGLLLRELGRLLAFLLL